MAVLAGMAVAGSVLVAPGVVAAPTAGRAAAWGNNSFGQLGDNPTIDIDSKVPVAVNTDGPLAGKTVTAVSAGDWYTCAVADGKAYCWGYNYDGQLGNNSTIDSKVPVAVNTDGPLAGKTVTAVSAGDRYTCAVADGKAYCWGYNYYGQLGNNSTIDSSVPVAVKADSGPLAGKTVTAISTGGLHTCAVADGKAYCWGANGAGQLGDNNGPTDSLVPVAVTAVSGWLAGKTVTAISTGGLHTCAVADGKAYCWGDNLTGQLGDNTGPTDSKVPVPVNTGGPLASRTVTAISAGRYHTCVVAEGRASCWGYNDHGQLGDNNGPTDSKVPVPVRVDSGPLDGRTVTAISAGGSTRAWWPTGRHPAGARTSTGSWATTAPPTLRCRCR